MTWQSYHCFYCATQPWHCPPGTMVQHHLPLETPCRAHTRKKSCPGSEVVILNPSWTPISLKIFFKIHAWSFPCQTNENQIPKVRAGISVFLKKIQVMLIRVSVEGHPVGMWSTYMSPVMFHLLGHRNYSACVPCLRRTLQSCGRNCHRDLPGGLAIKTLSFHCRGHEFDPWLGN